MLLLCIFFNRFISGYENIASLLSWFLENKGLSNIFSAYRDELKKSYLQRIHNIKQVFVGEENNKKKLSIDRLQDELGVNESKIYIYKI